MKYEPNPVIRLLYVGPLVVVLTGFHCTENEHQACELICGVRRACPPYTLPPNPVETSLKCNLLYFQREISKKNPKNYDESWMYCYTLIYVRFKKLFSSFFPFLFFFTMLAGPAYSSNYHKIRIKPWEWLLLTT